MGVGVGVGALVFEDVPVLAEHPATANKVVMIASAASTRETSFINNNLIRSGATFVFNRIRVKDLCA